MIVSIFNYADKSKVKAKISLIKRAKSQLPSISDGWRFNFSKHSRVNQNQAYTLTTYQSPGTIEGCLIINLKNKFQVYMAFVEVAPHNRGSIKKYGDVAGCLIAFACRQSFINGREGYLAFDVLEQNENDTIKLMNTYSRKYNAVRLDDSTSMIILPKGSKKLIETYLK